jgi:hypothetical protein
MDKIISIIQIWRPMLYEYHVHTVLILYQFESDFT